MIKNEKKEKLIDNKKIFLKKINNDNLLKNKTLNSKIKKS